MTELAHPPPRGLWLDGARVWVLDQSLLPHRVEAFELDSFERAENAIATMKVRGAPLIGATAAFGLALALRDDASDETLAIAEMRLFVTRPTAVNLKWALNRVAGIARALPQSARATAAWQAALDIVAQDEAANAAIGRHGARLLRSRPESSTGRLEVATHCNAGALATCAGGTALAPVYEAVAQGLPVHVWVSETRPRNQGLLTAWELAQAHVPHTLIADNAAGYLMAQGRVDLVIVGADRIAANGDVVNKVGTYLKALAARDCDIPFYVAAPTSTIDWDCPNGAEVEIEERGGDEVRSVRGRNAAQAPEQIWLVEQDTDTANPAFDITEARLVTGIISEHGVAAPGSIVEQWKT